MTPLRIGVIGTGAMAATMIGAMQRRPEIDVVGVASATGSLERARALAAVCPLADAYAHTSDLLARRDVDLIYIANRTSEHAASAIAAMDAGKGVLCEKPFALSEAEAQRVAESARRNGVFFMEAVWTLLLPAYQRAFQLVAEGGIGQPSHLTAAFGYPRARDASSGVFQMHGGGVLLDRAVYPVSLALKLLGPVVSVNAIIARSDYGLDVGCSMQLSHASGGQSQLAVSLTSLLSNTAILAGSHGSITLGPPLVGAEKVTTFVTEAAAISPSNPRSASVAQSFAAALRTQPVVRRLKRALTSGKRETHAYGASQYLPLLDHVVELIRSGRKESDVVPIDFSLSVMRILDAASAQQKSPSTNDVRGQT